LMMHNNSFPINEMWMHQCNTFWIQNFPHLQFLKRRHSNKQTCYVLGS
jgi:hypothetical protein